MSPFKAASLLLIVVQSLAVIGLEGWVRLGVALVALLIYGILLGIGVTFIKLSFFTRAFCRGNPRVKQVSLTFDDGPDPQVTPRILDLLREREIQAAFFCVGEKVHEQPELARRIVEEGHLLCNHTYRHAWWTNFMTASGFRKEMGRTGEVIQRATGIRPRFFRPPMGLTNPHLGYAMRQEGLRLVGWDVRSHDRRRDADRTVARVLGQVRKGSIILLHDGGVSREHALGTVQGILDGLNAKGLEAVRVDHLIKRLEEGV